MPRSWGTGVAAAIAAIVIALFVNYLWGTDVNAGANPSGGTTSTTTARVSGSPSTTSTATPSEGTQQNLTVTPADLAPKQDQCTDDSFINHSIVGVDKGNSGYRQWSDAVSTPFSSSSNSGKYQEVLNENCGNPVVLDQNIQALSRITINGWNVGDHNNWMSEFEAKANKDGLTAFLTYKQDKDGNIVQQDGTNQVFVTSEYRQYAVYANILLSRFQIVGITTRMSQTNWHLPGGGLVAGKLARAVLNTAGQENLPSLRMELTEKARDCVYAIGFNTSDKRFETFACNRPAPPKTTSPPVHHSTPATSQPPVSHPKPKPSPSHVTPKPKPTQKKPCPSPSPTKTHTTPPPSHTPSPTPTPTKTHTTPPPSHTPSPTPTPKPSCKLGQVGTYPHCLTPKDPSSDAPPPQGVTPAPADKPEPTTPSPAPVKLDPSQAPGSDTGSDVPVQGATPMPTVQPSTGSSQPSSEPSVQPTTDPSVAPAPSDPATGHISDPG